MPCLALKCGYELGILRKEREFEVAVVVRNHDIPRPVEPNPDCVVCDSWVFFLVSLSGTWGGLRFIQRP